MVFAIFTLVFYDFGLSSLSFLCPLSTLSTQLSTVLQIFPHIFLIPTVDTLCQNSGFCCKMSFTKTSDSYRFLLRKKAENVSAFWVKHLLLFRMYQNKPSWTAFISFPNFSEYISFFNKLPINKISDFVLIWMVVYVVSLTAIWAN